MNHPTKQAQTFSMAAPRYDVIFVVVFSNGWQNYIGLVC